MAAAVVVIVATVVVLVVGVVVLARQGHPEQTASHEPSGSGEETESSRLYRGVDRPGGPDLEDDGAG